MVKNIIKKEKIELLYAGQILPIGTITLLIKKMFKIPYIVYVYGQDLVISKVHFVKNKLVKRILSNSDQIVACSNYTKNLVIDFGINENKISVIYPIPDTKIINYSPDQITDFLKLKKLENCKIILTVGNIVKRKGHDMVIKGLPEVIKKIPNIKYVIVGMGSYKSELQKLAIRYNLNKYVQLYDNISNEDLGLFYQTCDLFIMPSRLLTNKNNKVIDVEGFGMVYLEANLYSKPVIGGRSGGVPEAIENEKSGILVDPNNELEISEAIIHLLEDNEYASRLGRYGRKRVLSFFRSQNESNKIINLAK